MQIITLPGNPDFNDSLRKYFAHRYPKDSSFVNSKTAVFASTEVYSQILENVRGSKVFVVQSSSGSFSGSYETMAAGIAENAQKVKDSLSFLLSHEDAGVRAAAQTTLFGLTGIEAGDRLTPTALRVFLTRQVKRSANDDFMQFLVTLDALVRTDVGEIRCVLPFIPYLRQDRKASSREPISARLISDMIELAGTDRLKGIITSEMHVPQEQGFFHKPVDNLPMTYLYAADLLETMKIDGLKPENCVVISPDLGGEKRAEGVANLIGCEVGVFKKERGRDQNVQNRLLLPVGAEDSMINGKVAIIIDDIVDSGNSLNEAATNLKKYGVRKVIAYIAHGILTEKAPVALASPGIDVLITTNGLPLPPYMRQAVECGRVRVINAAPYFAEAMIENNGGRDSKQGSVSRLFSVDAMNDLYSNAGVKLGHSLLSAPTPA